MLTKIVRFIFENSLIIIFLLIEWILCVNILMNKIEKSMIIVNLVILGDKECKDDEEERKYSNNNINCSNDTSNNRSKLCGL